MTIRFGAILPDRTAIAAFCLLSLFLFCGGSRVSAQQYEVTNLVSDVPGLAPVTDPNLVNPWGLISSATSPWWVANNGTGKSTLYNGAGVPQPTASPLIVTVTSTATPSGPTGIVFNGSSDFKLTAASTSAARFIFVTTEGTISGWAPSVAPTSTVVKFTSPNGAVYLGATLGTLNRQNVLYVADFSHGTVDAFNGTYTPVTLAAGAFTDPQLPEGYAPFNVQNINGNIYVALAKVDPVEHEEEAGRGLGYVDVFDSSGTLLQRFENGPWMNAPWGLALAPSGFGKASGKLLVGMFGSGEIATFDPTTGEFTGLLRGSRGRPIDIEGLWALRFGNGAGSGPTTTLYFTAGIEDETHGLFGTITPIPKNGKGPNGDDDDDN